MFFFSALAWFFPTVFPTLLGKRVESVPTCRTCDSAYQTTKCSFWREKINEPFFVSLLFFSHPNDNFKFCQGFLVFFLATQWLWISLVLLRKQSQREISHGLEFFFFSATKLKPSFCLLTKVSLSFRFCWLWLWTTSKSF